MNKKMVKVLSIIMILLMMISMTSTVFAAKEKAALEPSGVVANTAVDTTSIGNMGGNLVAVLQAVGIVLSVVILIVIGLKYMMGSAEEKADYKKTLMPYVLGAALIFTASAFAQTIYNFFQGWNA